MIDAPALIPFPIAQRIVVGVCDFAVSNNPQVVLSTYALGSCVGVIAYDPLIKAGGIIHFMLPGSRISPPRAARHPAMFADTGLPPFLRALTGLKASTSRLRILVTGGAAVLSGHDPFRIGERNVEAALSHLADLACTVHHQDVGGSYNRTIHLELGTGRVSVQKPHDNPQWLLSS